MADLTIRNLENLSGIKAHTIRAWEHRYQAIRPRRSETNIRYYCSTELKRLLDISLLNRAGLRISQIRQLSNEEIRERISTLPDPALQGLNRVNQLIGAMIDMDTPRFEMILDRFSREKGIHETVSELIFPFLSKSGLLWKSGELDIACEQLALNVVRQKLTVALDRLPPVLENKNPVLLFLPESNHHETGLLLSHYLLSEAGIPTLYLGDNVPLDDLRHVAGLKSPALLLTHLVHCREGQSPARFFRSFQQVMPGMKLIVSGKKERTQRAPDNLLFIQTEEEFRKLPERISEIYMATA